MNISSLVSQYTQLSQLQSAQKISSDPVAKAYEQANSRVGQQLESTKVQLSAFGKIKGALSEVQTASTTLSDPKKTATTADIKKAVEGFVSSYNKTNSAVSTAIKGDGKQAGALADDSRARVADSDLRRTLSAGSNNADLKKIGITQNKDGSLSVDTKALDNALKSNSGQVLNTVAGVAGQVSKTASRELASSGNVGSSVSSLSSRSRTLETKLSTQQEQTAAAQRTVEQNMTRLNDAFASGVSAYQRMNIG